MRRLDPRLDPRLTPARGDIAADFLKGQVSAKNYVTGSRQQIDCSSTALRGTPDPQAMMTTQLLLGETFVVYDQKEGWAWGQSEGDGYVGYLQASTLCDPPVAPTHRVRTLGTPIYPVPDIKTPAVMFISMCAKVAVTDTGGRFSKTRYGFVFSEHLEPISAVEPDYVATASTFLGVPYLWGGKESLGIDCSGLVQIALERAGINCPRDADMQEQFLGVAVDDMSKLARGDFVFWKGHVGIMVNETEFIHANATHMVVTTDNLKNFVASIQASEGPVTSVRRL